MQFADNAGPDQPSFMQADKDHCWALTESKDAVVYVDQQRMSRSDCTDVHTDLDLRWPQNA